MISFFTTLGNVGIPQHNAMNSWRAAVPGSEMIIIGSVEDRTRLAKTDPHIARTMQVVPSIHGLPLINALFARADSVASHLVRCYVNSDIILTDDFLPAVKLVAGLFKEFMITGQRWDTRAIKTEIDFRMGYRDPFGPAEWQALRDLVLGHDSTVLHITAGMDYFCYRGNVWPDIPPYVSAYAWDTDLMCMALEQIDAVVDGTRMITAVHQNHSVRIRRDSPMAKRNLELLGRGENWRQRLRGTQHARYILESGRVRRK